jgi:MFS family permease
MQTVQNKITKDLQYYKFCTYGFLKNLRFFEPFLLLFFLDVGLTFLQIGILYSIREIARNLLEIPAGIIADSLGRKRTMITSFMFYIISFVVFYFSETYTVLICAMLLYALGDAFRTGTHKAMIFDYLKLNDRAHQKVHYYGHTRSWSQIGSAVSSLIAGGFIFWSGNFRMIFLFSIVPYLLDLILVSSYPKVLDGLATNFDKRKIIENFKRVFLDFLHAFKTKELLKAVTNLSVHTGYFRALKDYLQPVLQTLALSLPVFLVYTKEQRTAIVVAIVYFVIYMLTSFSSRNSGRFSQIFHNLNKPLNLTLLLGLLFGLISGLLYENQWIIISCVFFIGIYLIENLRKPIGISYVADTVNKDILATVLSAESQAHTIISAIMAPLLGFMADNMGLGYSVMVLSGMLILLFPVFILRKKK